MSEQQLKSGYSGFAYGEVTSDSKKNEGQHIGGLASKRSSGLVFDQAVRSGTTELGFTPLFHKETPFEQAQIDALTTDLQARFAQEGLAPQMVAKQHKQHEDHLLGITFYVPVADKEKLERVINDIDSNAKEINIPAADATKEVQRANGNNWSDSLGDRTGRRKG